jgi:hypothetical protein
MAEDLGRLPDDERHALRRKLIDAIPRWYSPWGHLAVPSLFGLSVMAGCIALLEPLAWWHLMAVPATYLLANIGEWRAHKYWLHRRSKIAPVLYDRHTPQHHMIYVTEDMAVRDRREWRLVLIPAYGIMMLFVGVSIPAAAVWLAGFRNIALLFVATEMAYVLSYEWLHLSYHMPEDSSVGRLWLVRTLRRHHAVHHDPRLMQRWNFNVTVPLWDWVKGTSVKSVDDALSRRPRPIWDKTRTLPDL